MRIAGKAQNYPSHDFLYLMNAVYVVSEIYFFNLTDLYVGLSELSQISLSRFRTVPTINLYAIKLALRIETIILFKFIYICVYNKLILTWILILAIVLPRSIAKQ